MEQTSLGLTMENFHHCSHLPIRAFNKEGKEIASYGLSDQEAKITKAHLTSKMQDELLKRLLNEPIIYHPLTDEIYLTFCRMDSKASTGSAFIVGPYTASHISKEALVFKPLHCMSHLLEMLYSIHSSHNIKSDVLDDLNDQNDYDDTQSSGLTTSAQAGELCHNTSLHCLEPCDSPRAICPLATHSQEEDYSYHVTKAEIYIEKNYHKPLTLQELADYLGINKSYFCTIFKKVTKQSFCTYTNNVRIEKSKHLLATTDDSILDIALTIGFSSSSYFNNTFKKIVGQTPLDYRFHNRADS